METLGEVALARALRTVPAASSHGRGWGGLAACLWEGKVGEYRVDPLPELWLILHAAGSSRLAATSSGRRVGSTAAPGLVTIIPAGTATEWVIGGRQDAVTLHLPLARLSRLVEDAESARRAFERLRFRFAVADPLIAASLRALLQELRAPTQAGSLYADRLADVLLLHLLRSTAGTADVETVRGLSPRALRSACERLETSVEEGVSLEDLAREVGMSRFYFARAFRRSTARSPHQYLTELRVERAKQLLHGGDLPIVEVALACGFSGQPHFTRTFHRLTGETPAAFRRRH